MYRLVYRRQARNYLARLPQKTKAPIVQRLHALAADPDDGSLDVQVLKAGLGFRLRVGKFRVLYRRKDDVLIIEVVKVRARGDVYKG